MSSDNNNNNNMRCLVEAMDRLWFQQIILLSQPNNTSLVTPQANNLEEKDDDDDDDAESLLLKSQSSSFSTSSSIEDASDDTNSTPRISKANIRPKRRSDSFNNDSRRGRRIATRLEKSSSCRSLGELELEELRGFLDLGFTFKKEHLSPRMISLIPGLQRLDSLRKNKSQQNDEDEEQELQEQEDDNDDEKGVIIRPYLSEAWLIRRPSSPLLNLKVPRASQASDMKKHLRFWARIVASEIQQES